jgi:hypothetical protein
MPPMLRSLPRATLNALTVLSLLLFAAACVLWARSYGGGSTGGAGDRLSAYVEASAARYTVHSERGTLTLYAPPTPPHSPPSDPSPLDLAAAVRDDQLVWEVNCYTPVFPDYGYRTHYSPRGRQGTPVSALAPLDPDTAWDPKRWRFRVWRPPFPADVVARPLLAALEDPDRWVAAHVVLTRVAARRYEFAFDDHGVDVLLLPPDGNFLLTENGLRAVLYPGPATGTYTYNPGTSYPDEFRVHPCSARIDPGQRPALLEQWHRRLDVSLAAAPHRLVVAGTLVLPGLRLASPVLRRRRQRRRSREGLCPACGYDLRASPGRCPECGAVPAR